MNRSVISHYRLAATPAYFDDGSGNPEWMAVHGAFPAALTAGAASPHLERLRRQLYDASELYRYWSGALPSRPIRRDATDEHQAICEAALAPDTDAAVSLLAAHLETTARQLEEAVHEGAGSGSPLAV